MTVDIIKTVFQKKKNDRQVKFTAKLFMSIADYIFN